MKSKQSKFRIHTKFVTELIEKWRWLILTIIGLSLLWVEIQEFLVIRILNQAFHYFEVFQYTILLAATGLLIELLARSNRAHKQAMKILEYKHHLSLELTSNDDWKFLVQKITEIPNEIAEEVDEAYLLERNPMTGKFDVEEHWIAEDQSLHSTVWNPLTPCSHLLKKSAKENSAIHLCQGDNDETPWNVYSLGIPNQNSPTTILKFRLGSGLKLSSHEKEIFNNISDEINIALQTSRDRKQLSEMQTAEAAMAERRTVSAYVHDQLGQNLGYLHLRLDQLRTNEEFHWSSEVKKELARLQEVAHESYEIVRDILKKIQPETLPHLTNLLREQARNVSRRANFELDFKIVGKSIPLLPEIRQRIFFAFCEALNNVEKHAHASRVEILVTWENDSIEIVVSDNGTGFDPEVKIEAEHFGMEIMNERIKKLNGKLVIGSQPGKGTRVSLCIPLETKHWVPA